LSKTDDRLDDCYAAIRAAMPTNPTDAGNAITLLTRLVDASPARHGLGNALSLGSRTDNSQAETDRRAAVRCAMMLDVIVGGQPAALLPSLKQKYIGQPLVMLQREIVAKLPLYDVSPHRASWNPTNFTLPATGAGNYDPRFPNATTPFRYIVFGMMNSPPAAGKSYTDILADPEGTLRTFLISTSVITQGKVATYYPYGLILCVPEECIISTHSKDQTFRNYNTAMDLPGDTPQLKDLRTNDLRANIRAVTARFPIQSVDDILNGTTGVAGMERYNEVTVLGSFGSRQIQVVGVFKKVNAAGNNFIRRDSKKVWVTPAIDRLIAATRLPVIRLLDTSGLDREG
jgi:hypothetical protein